MTDLGKPDIITTGGLEFYRGGATDFGGVWVGEYLAWSDILQAIVNGAPNPDELPTFPGVLASYR